MDGEEARAIGVVLADANADVRLVLRRSLELAEGVTVRGEAEDGLGAVAAVRNHFPDAIVVDLDLPILGGSDLVDAIRRHSPRTKIINCSATYGELESIQAGIDAFLPKPISRPRLVETLRLLCGETES